MGWVEAIVGKEEAATLGRGRGRAGRDEEEEEGGGGEW